MAFTESDLPTKENCRDSRVARYLADEAEARRTLETHTPAIRARLEAWQTGQSEWFSNTLLEIVAEFIAFEDALSAQPAPGVVPRLPREQLLYWEPDYLNDEDGLKRWRDVASGRGHDMVEGMNKNSLRRLLDTIERLRAALQPKGEAR